MNGSIPLMPSSEYFKRFVKTKKVKLSLFEKACGASYKIFKVSCPRSLKKKLKNPIFLSGLKVNEDEVFSLTITSFLFSFFVFLGISLLDFPSLAILLIFPPFIAYNIFTYPIFYSEVIRIRAGNETVSIILYIVTYLSLNPVYEKAVEFAASRCHGPLGNDLKKVIWDLRSGKYSNIKEPTDPSTYSQGASYQFNATWTDETGISQVWIENNFTGSLTNSTVTTYQGSEWYYDVSDLAVGTYVYKWFANDTANQVNLTSQYTFTVSKATSEIALYINGSRADYSTTNYTAINLTADLITPDIAGTVYIYRNDTLWDSGTSPLYNITENWSIGYYTLKANWSGNENYTSDEETWYVNVSETSSTTTTTTTTTTVSGGGGGGGQQPPPSVSGMGHPPPPQSPSSLSSPPSSAGVGVAVGSGADVGVGVGSDPGIRI